MKQYIWMVLIGALSWVHGGESVVENGLTPSGKATMVFTEELRINADSGDEDYYLWSGATLAVEVDKRGHMYVVDTGGLRIIEFDDQGKYIRQIGKKGEGPGEYQLLKSFKILSDGTAVGFNDLRAVGVFNYYNDQIQFVESKREDTGMALQSVIFSPNGKHMSSFYMTRDDKGQLITHTAVLDRTFKPLLVLHDIPVVNFDPSQVANGEWWSEFYSHWFGLSNKGQGLFAFREDGDIYTALTNKYKITRYDQSLNKKVVFQRKYKPIPQTEKDLDAYADPIRAEILSSLPANLHQYITPRVVSRAIELAQFPPSKQPIFGMVPMEDGGLLVIHDFNPITGKVVADIFNESGKYIGQTNLPKVSVNIFGSFFGNPVKMILKGGKAYAIESNEDGETALVRYRYQLKN